MPVASGTTVVRVNPPLIEYWANATGQQFTINVTINNVTNLYGFDLEFKWNTSYLAYVNRSVYVPNNASSPYGVLWSPVLQIEDQVNTTAGTYWIAYASMYPASSFNGSGTVFNMTFRILHHPQQPEPNASIALDLNSTDLSNNIGDPIPHTSEDGIVKLYALPGAGHDIAVSNVTSYKKVIFQGFTSNFTVTVENHGGFLETFNVTLNGNMTATGNTTMIAKKAIINMLNGASTILNFTWDTTGFAKGNYTINVVADVVPNETKIDDNNFTDGHILIPIIGDLTGGSANPWDFVPDGVVDGSDLSIVAKCFGSWPGALPPMIWNANCDVNDDGVVDGSDLAIVAKHFGEGTLPP
jgi:hypothetical protein